MKMKMKPEILDVVYYQYQNVVSQSAPIGLWSQSLLSCVMFI